VSIGVVVCAGTGYLDHLPGWWESVQGLTTAPDMVVIVTDDVAAATATVPAGVSCTIVAGSVPFVFADWLNAGFAACDTDWVVWCGVDDRYYPHALDGIDGADADVVAYGFRYSTGQVWPAQAFTGTAEDAVARNPVPCGSPVRRWLWQAHPFQAFPPYRIGGEDWLFWVQAAECGARFAATGREDVLYDYGPHHFEPDYMEIRSRIRGIVGQS
jgi:hypothetical protein